MSTTLGTASTDVEIDTRALLKSLLRVSPYLIIFAGLIAVGTFYFLSRIPPSFKSETTILIETGESGFTRPQSAVGDTAAALDTEAITGQVQLIRSRDLAAIVAKELDLAARPEYQEAIKGGSLIGDLLARFGLAQSASESSVEERILAAYYDNLQVSAIANSRVIAIDFSSTDPKLAADGANAIAAEYIALQRSAKRDTTVDATNWLETEIADLRAKVKDSEGRVEQFRTEHDLFTGGGTAETTLPEQQLADINAELTRLRAAKVEAEARAAQIRASLATGAVPNITDVLNSQLIQRLVEQQVALRADIAELSATLLPEHPRMKEVRAQLADLDSQIDNEAQKIVAALEAEAELSATREAEIARSLEEQKVTAASANDAGVQLRALEREAAAQRDLLDTYLRRYREALARQNADYLPADARVISRAAVPISPDFPKVIPMTAAATVAALLVAIAFVLIRELASGRPMRRVALEPLPVVPDAIPIGGRLRWADDHGVRRMMPGDPTIAPQITNDAEGSLAAIADRIIAGGKRRVLVTLADGVVAGRPLAAVALARALARTDHRTVLIDLRGDGADGAMMGQGADLPDFTDLFAGDASFAQVIFRDRKSRAHFIPAGKRPVSAEVLTGERLATVLSALDHTYDHLVLDVGDDMIAVLGETAGAAMVVTEFGEADPRTVRAFDRIAAAAPAATVLLLIVDPTSPEVSLPEASADEAA